MLNNELLKGIIFGIVLMFFLFEIKNTCLISTPAVKLRNLYIQILLRQSARWAVAAQNDISPLIRTLHANYAAGYLWALKDIATAEEIKIATGIDINKLTKKILEIQDESTKYATKNCPQYKGQVDEYLAKISGEA